MLSAAISRLAVAVVVAEPSPVVGGDEVALTFQALVTHVRASTGEIVETTGRVVRWRAPRVCAPMSAEIMAQDEHGGETSLPIRIAPGPAASGLALSMFGGRGVVQVVSESAVEWRAGAGTVEPVTCEGSCRCAVWSLPLAERPDYAVVAAFAGGELIGWTAVGRAASTPLTVMKARPRAWVTAHIGGRRFAGLSDGAGVARLQIQVPPGVRLAQVAGAASRVEVDLGTPAPTADHVLTAPDESRWLLRIDPSGVPYDGVRPEGAERAAIGTYRLPRDAPALPSAPSPSPPSAHTTTVNAPLRIDQDGRSRPQSWAWRLGVSATAGSALTPGSALTLGRGLPMGPLTPEIQSALWLSGSRHALNGAAGDTTLSVAGIGVWGDIPIGVAVGAWRVVVSAGAGGATAWRRIAPRFQQPISQWTFAPLATGALRVGSGRFDGELRLLVSDAALGAQRSALLGMAGLAWRWPG